MGIASATEDTALDAAERTLSTLTAWLFKNPECTYITKFDPLAKLPFQLHITTPTKTHTFRGRHMQDAYAQAAQTIMFEELR